MVDYTRLAIQGTLPGGEDWSVNPAFISGGSGQITLANAQAWATAVATLLSPSGAGIPQQVAQLMSEAAAITNIRVSAYTDKVLDFYADGPLAAPAIGTGSPTGPTQQAIAVSLGTGGFSRSSRGRFFWPALKYPIDVATTRFTKTALAGTLADFQTMLVAIEDACPAPYIPELAVISRNPFSGGVVSELRLGDVMDSQRRRKTKLTENYARVAFVRNT